MAKDDRLYARFDIGMDEHPKVMLLSDVAFRALVEGTLYSRRQLTDGFLAERVVFRKWGREAADELVANDPERPSWVRVEKDGVAGYMIHDYGKHQTTTADIEAKRSAGRKGGLAKAARSSSTGLAPATNLLEQNAGTSLAKTETETETKTPSSNEEGKTVPRKRGTRLDPSWTPQRSTVERMELEAPGVNFEVEHRSFVDYWIAQPGQKGVKTDWDATWRNWMRRVVKDRRPARPSNAQQAALLVERFRDRPNELEA